MYIYVYMQVYKTYTYIYIFIYKQMWPLMIPYLKEAFPLRIGLCTQLYNRSRYFWVSHRKEPEGTARRKRGPKRGFLQVILFVFP